MNFTVKSIREVEDKFVLNEKQMNDISLEYLRNLLRRDIIVTMNLSGDYSFYVDKDGNVIYSDSYDYHRNEYSYYSSIGKIPCGSKHIHDTIMMLEAKTTD